MKLPFRPTGLGFPSFRPKGRFCEKGKRLKEPNQKAQNKRKDLLKRLHLMNFIYKELRGD